jgi:hypothetical protein
MYAGCYFVAGKHLHPLAIKARGRIVERGRRKEGKRREER